MPATPPPRPGLTRALGLTVLSAVVPGSGLTGTRWRRVGWAAVGVVVVALLALVVVAARQGVTSAALGAVTNPSTLQAVAVGAGAVGVLWCAAVVATAVLARPAGLAPSQSRTLAAVTSLLVLAVAAGAFTTARYAVITRDTVTEVFGGGAGEGVAGSDLRGGSDSLVTEGEDPWRDTPRVNVLLLGSDAGVGRTGTRTDSMVVASIDTRTGHTTLISLPRNLERVPLPADSPLRALYPSGVYGKPFCIRAQSDPADRCMLNAIWTEVDQYEADHPGSFAGAVPGREQTRAVIAETLGLPIQHLVVIDLKGFEKLVDAMGGVDVDVKTSASGTPLPIGGKLNEATGGYVGVERFFTPGRQHLDGHDALWYARTRAADTDSYRQARQRCVVQALVRQVNPGAMIAAYPDLARIARENVYTDIRADELPAFAELVERVQGSTITSVSLTAAEGVQPGRPDLERVRALVRRGLTPPVAPTPKPSPTSTTATPTASASTTQGPGGAAAPGPPASASTAPGPTPQPTPSLLPNGMVPIADYSRC